MRLLLLLHFCMAPLRFGSDMEEYIYTIKDSLRINQDPYSPLPLSSNLSSNLSLRVNFKDGVILCYPYPYPYPQILRVTVRFSKVAPEVLKK